MAGLGATTLKKKQPIPTPTVPGMQPAPKPPTMQPTMRPIQPVKPVQPAPAAAPAVATTPTQAAAAAPQTTGLGATAVPITDPNDPRYTGHEDDVVQLTNDILATDSLLMQQAEADGYAQANSRGLMNSSMGVGAAQEAVVNSAVPLASQQSSQNFQKNMSGLGTQQEQLLAKQQIRADAVSQGRDIRSTEGQAALDREQELALQQTQIDADQAAQTAQIEAEKYMQQQEIAMQQMLAESDLSEAEKELANTAYLNAMQDYNDTMANILNNPNIPADERQQLLEANQKMLEQRIDYMNAVYDTSFDWPPNPWEVDTKPPPPVKAPPKK